jgi:hypothetical protein
LPQGAKDTWLVNWTSQNSLLLASLTPILWWFDHHLTQKYI